MVNISRRILVVMVLAGAAGLGWWLMRPDDTAIIRQQWRALLQLVQKESSPGLLTAATKAQELSSYFTTGAVVEVGGPYPLSVRRSELPALYHQAWSYLDHIELRSRGEDITLDGASARMEVTIDYDLGVRGERQTGLDAYRLHWVREEGDWRIRQVERMETVRNPAANNAP